MQIPSARGIVENRIDFPVCSSVDSYLPRVHRGSLLYGVSDKIPEERESVICADPLEFGDLSESQRRLAKL